MKDMGISPMRSPSHKEVRVRLADGSIVQVPVVTSRLWTMYVNWWVCCPRSRWSYGCGPRYALARDQWANYQLEEEIDSWRHLPIAEISVCSLIEPDSQSIIVEHKPKSDALQLMFKVAKHTLELSLRVAVNHRKMLLWFLLTLRGGWISLIQPDKIECVIEKLEW
jgi:hypothetical protein